MKKSLESSANGRTQLNPAVQAFLDRSAALGAKPVNLLSPEEAKKQYIAASPFVTPAAPAVESIRDFEIPGPHGKIPLRHYLPQKVATGETLPTLIYIHGGGWTIGNIETHDVLCRQLALETPCAVISVDYRLAPEYKFPVAVDECIATAKWIVDHASDLHVDTNRLAIGGDSAGGNLAAVVALDARDRGGPRFCLQVLIYPATDQHCSTPSFETNGKGYVLTKELVHYFREQYLGGENFADWRASPLLATNFKGLPPAFVMTAGYDPLVDEGRQYADKLKAAGVPTTLICYEDMIHGFIRLGGVIPDAQIAVSKTAELLAESFKQK